MVKIMIKLCTIDLDGTLFDKEKNISKENIYSIKKAKENGCKIVICTGRPINGVLHVLEQLELNTNDDYVICYNGSKIFNAGTKEVIYTKTINGKTVKDVYQESIRLGLHFHAFRENEEFVAVEKNPYSDVEVRINKLEYKYIDFNTIDDNELFLKCMIVDDKDKITAAMNKLNPKFYELYSVVRSSHIFLEFLNKETNKGHALIALAKYLNIDITETMAIGDAGNDLDMIKFAHIGVAMENAYENVKKAANFITASNEESGVAVAINKFVNNC